MTKTVRSFLESKAGSVLARYIRFVHRTGQIAVEPEDGFARLEAWQPVIIGLWHGQFMLVPALKPPGLRLAAMVARHGDAAALGTALEAYGVPLVLGAGAGGRKRDRGGARAALEALRTLAAGTSIGITADVPPGPARRCGDGIVALARLSGRPIVPVGIASSRFRVLDTWSRMTINLPYAKIGFVVGSPIAVPAKLSDADAESMRLQVEAAVDRVTRRAYALTGADIARTLPQGTRRRSVALGAYRLATRALQPVAPVILRHRARRGKEDPARCGERLGIASVPRPDGPLAWFHAASIGEANAVLPLIEAMKRRRPALNVLITTGTVTSARVAADRLGALATHQYVPLDTRPFAERFLEYWRPSLAVFAESEIWPNLVLATSERKIPLALVNARMSERSFERWRARRRMAANLFGRFDAVLAQSDKLARRLARLGADRAQAVGNLKVDAPALPVDAMALTSLRITIGERRVLLAASTQPGEDEIVAAACRQLAPTYPDLLLIIVPRHPERGPGIVERLSAQGFLAAERSRGDTPSTRHQIYVADTVGELGLFYSLAPIAFIGGSLVPHGGQNPLEAVKLGAAVLTGPHVHNFKDAYTGLLRRKGARAVTSVDELAAAIAALLADPAAQALQTARARQAVALMAGGLDRTLEILLALIDGKSAPADAP